MLIPGFISGVTCSVQGLKSDVYCFVLGFISGVTAVRTGSTEAVSESPSRRRINSTRTSVRTVRKVATAWSPPNSSPTGGVPSLNDSSINYRYSTIIPPSLPPAHSMVTTKLITDRGRAELKRLITQLQVQYHNPTLTPPPTAWVQCYIHTQSRSTDLFTRNIF